MTHKCFECGELAPFGHRFPGRRDEVPEKFRGYLWSCADHRSQAKARRDRAYEKAKADGLVRVEPQQITMDGWLRDAG